MTKVSKVSPKMVLVMTKKKGAALSWEPKVATLSCHDPVKRALTASTLVKMHNLVSPLNRKTSGNPRRQSFSMTTAHYSAKASRSCKTKKD